jgi:hypothetical protein
MTSVDRRNLRCILPWPLLIVVEARARGSRLTYTRKLRGMVNPTESPVERMMIKQKRTNPVILQPGMIIGANAAEMDDEFLLKCFVHYPPVDLCMSISSRGMVVDGRTGSGKTAILELPPVRLTPA